MGTLITGETYSFFAIDKYGSSLHIVALLMSSTSESKFSGKSFSHAEDVVCAAELVGSSVALEELDGSIFGTVPSLSSELPRGKGFFLIPVSRCISCLISF